MSKQTSVDRSGASGCSAVCPVYGWAWLCDFGLCEWAEPTKEQLMRQSKPSPEAKPVYVALVPVSQYRELKR